jgi:glycosyltransferase involved in cell wall biosynthesis
MKLSIIIPAYNEIDTIPEVLDRVRAENFDKEIIVVDDRSTDGTREFLRKQKDIKLIEHEHNFGKGASIKTALEHVTGDVVIIQDADLEYDPADYPKLVQPIIEGKADIVYGTRFAGQKPKMRLANYIANKLFAWLATVLYGVRITDEATCYKAFRTEAIKSIQLKCKRFDFCPEVTARLLKRGWRYAEVPISYQARTYGQGKKIKWFDGVQCIWTLLKYRFTG